MINQMLEDEQKVIPIPLSATVEGMLIQMEHSNKFSSAVTLGNNQALSWQTDREREIATGSKVVTLLIHCSLCVMIMAME